MMISDKIDQLRPCFTNRFDMAKRGFGLGAGRDWYKSRRPTCKLRVPSFSCGKRGGGSMESVDARRVNGIKIKV